MPPTTHRGRLKLLLGYAAGVGKTYKMLEEAHKLQQQGMDVVIGYFEPHGRQDTIDRTQGLETIPRRKVFYRKSEFEEMDTEAILRRQPQVCVVDEFAHTNVPGSERAKRWEDVHVLLEAGIDVLTNMNVQHLESLNGLAVYRCARAGNHPRLGRQAGGRSRDGGFTAAGSAQPLEARRGLFTRKSAPGDGELF